MITETTTNNYQRIPKMTTFSMKKMTRIGTWNVRTLLDTSKLAQVCREFANYNLLLLGLCETRWPEAGEFNTSENLTFLYSGKPPNEPRSSGVGLLLSKEARSALINWKPYGDRIITARFRTRARNLTCVQCYAPTETSESSDKENFYSHLNRVLSLIPRGDIVILMGDFNAQLGADNTGRETIMGQHGIGRMTENGELFTEICSNNNLVIGGTIFPHKTSHKVTWVSPDRVTENQIDHIAISKSWRRTLLDVRSKRGADCSTDHHLVIGNIRLKVAAIRKPPSADRKYDVRKLKNVQIRHNYVDDLKGGLVIQRAHPVIEWQSINNNFNDAAREHIGYKTPKRAQWMSDDTWKLILERKKIKAKQNIARTRGEKITLGEAYRRHDLLVKRSARNDKRRWHEELARNAQKASEEHRPKDLYAITKKLTGKNFPNTKPLMNSEGVLSTSKNEQLEIWRRHYSSMLSNAPSNLSNICSCATHTVRQDISTECPDISEVLNAINALKANKAPGADNIAPEMLKADPQLTANILLPLIENFWLTLELDSKLKEGIIVNLPKKGNLTDCRNWRGITILSAVNKIIAHVINKRISDAVMDDIRPEQAGFRPQKSCVDHINTLRIIIEQSAEWQSPLYMIFIDFEKAFDTLSHDAIWSALACKGVPPKIIMLTQALYKDVRCRVVHDNALSNSFNVVTGVRQGCILSPLLFNIVLDVIVRNATQDSRGIRWGLTQQLESLEYADDICLLSHSYRHMSAKLKSVETEAAKAGLKINIKKSKVMRCNTFNNSRFKIQDVELEEVRSFCYLGSILTHTGGCSNDVAYRMSKANQAFGMLRPVWKSTVISKHTKISIFNSCVKSVLLYGCESWNTTTREINGIQVFVNRCLRRILKIFWPSTISNIQLWSQTNQSPINIEILKRKWRWIGHTLRRPQGDPTKTAIDWNPHGNTRRVGRPSHSWRRQLEAEVIQSGLSWREIKHLASNRTEWKEFVVALCSL